MAAPSPTQRALSALGLAVLLLGAQSALGRLLGGPLPVRLLLAYGVATVAILIATASAPLEPWRESRRAFALGGFGVLCGVLGFLLGRVGAHSAVAAAIAGLFSSGAVLALGTSLGASVGLRIAHPGHLLAVMLASSGADLWSVLSPSGISRAVVDSAAAVQRAVAVSAQVDSQQGPDAMIGLGDVIFSALYMGAARTHQLALGRMRLAVLLGLVASGLVALALGMPLPALPLMGLAVVVLVPEARKVAPRDRTATAFAGALLLAAIAVLALGRRPR